MNLSRNVSRRRFLTTAAGSTAASMLAPPAIASASRNLFGSPEGFDLGISGDLLPWRDQGVINTSKSPYAKLHSVPVRAVTIEEGFWYKRRKTNVENSIPTMRQELESHGRMNNFRRLVGKSSAPQSGPYFSDSDIYKWIDAVGWALQSGDQPELHHVTDSMIHEVVAIQEPGGVPEHLLPGRPRIPAHDAARPGSWARDVLSRPHDPGGNSVLSRHRR